MIGDRIIEPLASRCSKFRFKPLEQGSTRARMEMIAENEGVQTDPGVCPCVLFFHPLALPPFFLQLAFPFFLLFYALTSMGIGDFAYP